MLMSCLGIPIPGSSHTREHIVKEKRDSLVAGKTTQIEVLNLLEQPEGTFDDRTRWIYHIGTTERGSARFCYIMASGWSVGGKTEGCDPIGESTIAITYLDLVFKNQLLVSKKRSTSKVGAEKRGVCFDSSGRMSLQHENGETECPRESGWFYTDAGWSLDPPPGKRRKPVDMEDVEALEKAVSEVPVEQEEG